MSRQRRGRRGSSGNGKSKSNDRAIPSSHKGSSGRRRRRGSGGKSRAKSGKKQQPSGFKSIAPSPLMALHKITTSSPVGTGFNPLAEGFKSGSGDKQESQSFTESTSLKASKLQKAASETIAESCNGCDQVNVVIKAEGNMEDPDLLGIDPKVAVFAGEAGISFIQEGKKTDGTKLLNRLF